MSEYKYVMFEDQHGAKHPVIFPGAMVHKDIANHVMMANRYGDERALCLKPISAGFCQIVVATAFGESETLQMSSHEDDRQRINTHSYTGGHEGGMEPMIERMLIKRTCQLLLDMMDRGNGG